MKKRSVSVSRQQLCLLDNPIRKIKRAMGSHSELFLISMHHHTELNLDNCHVVFGKGASPSDDLAESPQFLASDHTGAPRLDELGQSLVAQLASQGRVRGECVFRWLVFVAEQAWVSSVRCSLLEVTVVFA